jgi:hypothetical protein
VNTFSIERKFLYGFAEAFQANFLWFDSPKWGFNSRTKNMDLRQGYCRASQAPTLAF